MIKVKCIGRDKNKAGVIKAYRLVDKNNNIIYSLENKNGK